jgi:hypothetical protein
MGPFAHLSYLPDLSIMILATYSSTGQTVLFDVFDMTDKKHHVPELFC